MCPTGTYGDKRVLIMVSDKAFDGLTSNLTINRPFRKKERCTPYDAVDYK